MSNIILKNITKRFGKSTAVDNLNLEINDGDFITLLGPSGCGKTTTLRMVAGLETPTEGEIWIDDTCVFSAKKGINVAPNKRGVGFLFQNYALWPHMTVYENIAFGLENLKWPKDKIRKKIDELLEMLMIEEFEHRYPSELSGGQQQRVAIARTLATEPKVLFMDEPLSNLDAKLRMDMRTELKRLHIETGSTFVYVTHDQLEAMTLSTRICLLKGGILQQYAPPLTIYHEPANTFIADFVGNPSINLLKAKASNINLDELKVELGDMNLLFCPKSNNVSLRENHDIIIGIRPEYVNIENECAIEGEIYSTLPSGMETIVKIKLADKILTSVVFQGKDFKVGEKVPVDFVGERCIIFDAESKKLLALGSLEIVK